MPQLSQHPLYDVGPLAARVDAGQLLLTPNLRLARRIKTEWDRQRAAAGDRVWAPLAVASAEHWLLEEWRRRCADEPALRRVLLSPGQARSLWQQVIRADQERGNYQLLQVDAAAALAQQARDNLLRFGFSPKDPVLRQALELDADCSAFLRWSEAFAERLAAGGFATAADVLQLLATAPPPPNPREVALVEFTDRPPLLRSTLARVCAAVETVPPGQERAELRAVACNTGEEELAAVAQWAQRVYRDEPDAVIGIVLADMRGDRAQLEYRLRREFDCLGSEYTSLPVNFSTGWPLAETPVVRDALALLQLLHSPVALATVHALLRSRFVDLPDRHTPQALRWTAALHELGRDSVPLAGLRNQAQRLQGGDGEPPLVMASRLQDLAQQRQWREPALPSTWMQRFRTLWSEWGWPAGALDSLEYQQVEHLYHLLDELAGYDAVCGAQSLGEAVSLLQRACADSMFQPQTADARIQVLGPLEAAGLQFDYLWLCRMQASDWPAAPRPNPLLPAYLQREADMPHASAEHEWRFARGLLAQYQRAAGVLYASYARERDGTPELPSALLQAFTPTTLDSPGLVAPGWREQQESLLLERVQDTRAPAPDPAELDGIGGGSGLLEDQSHCPFRAFARRRLRVQPLAEPGLAPDAAARGQLLHDALYALWGELGDAASLAALDTAGRQQVIADAVAAALAAMPAARRLQAGAAWCEQEAAHLRHLLAEWLAVEAQRGDFRVRARESRHALQLGGLQLELRMDRIDELPDGSLVLIDYKSGAANVSDWLGERPPRPQLPLYSLAADGEIAAIAFASVRARECAYVGLGARAVAPGVAEDIARAVRGRIDADSWESLLRHWGESLQLLAAEFLAGEARVDPLAASSCTYCGLQALCRVEVQAMPTADPAAGAVEAGDDGD